MEMYLKFYWSQIVVNCVQECHIVEKYLSNDSMEYFIQTPLSSMTGSAPNTLFNPLYYAQYYKKWILKSEASEQRQRVKWNDTYTHTQIKCLQIPQENGIRSIERAL